mmetsp:Transcript_44753/g.127769  ORF Transcript_44753/g.127769 Transcript_44753/m.127769 type:complete len:341 (+) Transcript_44753:915-1937(+)
MGRPRSCAMISCAASAFHAPCRTSQCGLSSSRPCSSVLNSQGTAEMSTKIGQSWRVPRRLGSPMTCAPSMATHAVSWNMVPRAPRRCGGAISPRYMGTATVVAPAAAPLTARPKTMSPTPVALELPSIPGKALTASRNAPSTNVAEVVASALRRPSVSASEAPAEQPNSAPRQKTETQKPQRPSSKPEPPAGMPRLSRIATAAVFMQPLLKPYCAAGRTPIAAAHRSAEVYPPWTLTVSSVSPTRKGWLRDSNDLPTEPQRDTREVRPGRATGTRSCKGDSLRSSKILSLQLLPRFCSRELSRLSVEEPARSRKSGIDAHGLFMAGRGPSGALLQIPSPS